MVDFGTLLDEDEASAPIVPRELYAQLPNKSAGYGYLWDVQAQVLNAWHDRRSEQDLVIKVNTGGGKTVDGLVILQSCLNEGIGPALYVAPDKYLAKQVLAEAAKLGIATVTNADDPRYLASEAIAVINAYTLFNGRTVFSDKRPTRAPAPIGSVVIDDAHAAIATTRKQLSLEIKRDQNAFDELLSLFADDLKQQSPDGYLDLLELVPGALARVPFWAWRKKIDQVRTILRSLTKSDKDPLYFQWPAVSHVLHFSRAVFADTAITITPPCPPIEHVTGFNEAKRRIYLTATLADDSVLVTDFNANPGSIANPITPDTAGDIGERMILVPEEINPSIKPEDIRREIVKLSKKYNTVVLVPSDKAFGRWADDADVVATADDIEKVVEDLRTKRHVGLVVLANKYDGIDLPQDACRILVLDGLPGAATGEERLASLLMSQEGGVDDRQVQRIEQGMGRGVRSNEDHCVIFMIGPKLAQLTIEPRTLARFSPATQAQLALSRKVAHTMDNQPLSKIVESAQQALDRDPGWVKLAKNALRSIPPQAGRVSHHAALQRRGFRSAAEGAYQDAAKFLGEAVDGSTLAKEQGWLQEQQAAYLDHVDQEHAQKLLVLARGKNSHVTRPLAGVPFRALEVGGEQAQRASKNLTGMFGSPTALRLGFESILDDLVFDPLRTEDFEEAVLQLGHVLGLGSQRPEHELAKGPDNLWALGDHHYWVIECKSGATSKKIGKTDAGQLGQSMLWFGERYASSEVATPVMIHPAHELYKDASPLPGMQVITPRWLGELKVAVQNYATALAASSWTDQENVASLLRSYKLTTGDLGDYLTKALGNM
jgi:hypothetical protein